MMRNSLDSPVSITMTRTQALLLTEAFHIADRVLDLGKILGNGGRLNSARTAVKKVRAALDRVEE